MIPVVGAVAGPDHARVLVEDHLEVGIARARVVLSPPFEHELPVRRRPGQGRVDAVTGVYRVEVVPVGRDRLGELAGRQALVEVLRARRAALQVAVRGHVDGRAVLPVEQDRERKRDRRRAVVAVIPDVSRARDERLSCLRRDDVVAGGHRFGEVDVEGALIGRQHEMEVDRSPTTERVSRLARELGVVRPGRTGRHVRIPRVRLSDRDPRRGRAQDTADAGGVRVAGVAHPLVELEGLARVDVTVAVGVVERRLVVDELRRRRRRRAHVDLVVEDVLLRLAVDRHAAVHPGRVEPRVVPVAAVIVARVTGLDRRVRLARQGAGNVADHIGVVPGLAVVGRDPGPALVARARRVPGVVPADHHVTVRGDGQRWLPLSAGAAVAVDPDRRAPRRPVVRRARVVDVARIAARAVLGIRVVDDPARAATHVAPAHVSPVGREHRGEVAARARARAEERPAHGDGRPRRAVVRVEHHVRAGAREAAAALVHAGDEHAPVRPSRDLDVADERGAVDRCRRGPGRASVVGVDDLNRLIPQGEVVPGDVGATVVRTRRRVVDPHRLAVVTATVVRAGGSGPGRPVRGHPDSESPSAAAAGDEDGDPLRVRGVVDDPGIAEVVPMAGAERVVVRPARAAVERIRAAADADRARVHVPRVVIRGNDSVPLGPRLGLGLGHVRVGAFAAGDQVLVHAAQ